MNRVYRLRRPYRTEWSFVGVRWVIERFDMERGPMGHRNDLQHAVRRRARLLVGVHRRRRP